MNDPSKQSLERQARAYLIRRDGRFERESYMPECFDELLALLKAVALAAQDAALEQAAKLREALDGVMKLIENGELVRDTSHDKESSYALRSINFVVKLKAAQEALAAAALRAMKGEG